MNPYLDKFTLTDEHGQEEQWEVQFKRITTAVFIDLTETTDGREIAERVHYNIGELVLGLWVNGESREMHDLPMEVEVEVFTRHPSFRLPAANREPTNPRTDQRRGTPTP